LGSHRGWEVCGEAGDGEDAITKAQELTPDLIVLDFLMPRKNGIDAAREICKVTPRTPIVLCTISVTPQLIDLARRAGIDATLSKSDLGNMVPFVEDLLRRHASSPN
jgi:two-component system chemotaxis response regulator CheY